MSEAVLLADEKDDGGENESAPIQKEGPVTPRNMGKGRKVFILIFEVNENRRALILSKAAPLITTGPNCRCIPRRLLESSLLERSPPSSSEVMELSSSSLVVCRLRAGAVVAMVIEQRGKKWKDPLLVIVCYNLNVTKVLHLLPLFHFSFNTDSHSHWLSIPAHSQCNDKRAAVAIHTLIHNQP